MRLQKDLREFIELLNSRGVKYIIVGGHAVAYHGHPRYTGDIDFFVEPSEDNANRILAALLDFGFGDLDLDPQDFQRPESVVQLGMPPNRIDMLTSISGVSFAQAWQARLAAELDKLPVCFISKDLLLENKRASGRAKDLADVAELSVGPNETPDRKH